MCFIPKFIDIFWEFTCLEMARKKICKSVRFILGHAVSYNLKAKWCTYDILDAVSPVNVQCIKFWVSYFLNFGRRMVNKTRIQRKVAVSRWYGLLWGTATLSLSYHDIRVRSINKLTSKHSMVIFSELRSCYRQYYAQQSNRLSTKWISITMIHKTKWKPLIRLITDKSKFYSRGNQM